LPADAPAGLCPQCLLRLGFEVPTAAPRNAATTTTVPGSKRFVGPELTELAQLLPQLEILELLGQGGMGDVYKARQRHLNRLVALKILTSEVAGDPEFAERFTREAEALAQFNHPNVCPVPEGSSRHPPR
jgi:serine/threonine protein kinase